MLLPGRPSRPRASSKKTRIETLANNDAGKQILGPRASSKKTRIETDIAMTESISDIESEGKFQENKD